jgi:hypothetical protein
VQVQSDIIAENEKLQERLDEQGADLYFMKQAQKEMTKDGEKMHEVSHLRAWPEELWGKSRSC